MVNFLETGDSLAQVVVYDGGKADALRHAFSIFLPEIPIRDKMDQIQTKDTLVIIPEEAILPSDFHLWQGATIVVSSAEHQQLEKLVSMPVRVITCGLGLKDTVTFSSRQDGYAVVSLLRALDGATGVVEPLDIPIMIPPDADDYPILAVAAAKIFLQGANGNPVFFQ